MDVFRRIEGEIMDTLSSIGVPQSFLRDELHHVSPEQFLGIEIKPWAKEIAELVLWIGYLQGLIRSLPPRKKDEVVQVPEPVLQNYGNIECRDAILAHDPPELVRDANGKPVSRWDGETYKKDPTTGAQVPDESARVVLYSYPNARKAEWPRADFIVGNPPFVGNWKMRRDLGDGYVETLRKIHDKIPESVDFVMYWWDMAAERLVSGKIRRFGFITTKTITQVLSRKVLDNHMNKGLHLALAIPNHAWVDEDASAFVRIAMTVATLDKDPGVMALIEEETQLGDGSFEIRFNYVPGKIHSNLQVGANVGAAVPLHANEKLCSPGVKLHGNGFLVSKEKAAELGLGRIEGLENHIRFYRNGRDVQQKSRDLMVIDLYGLQESEIQKTFPDVYQHILVNVKPVRDSNNEYYRRTFWWLFGRKNTDLRAAIKGLSRYITTVETSKHRVFSFLDSSVTPDNMLVNFGLKNGFFIGVLSSKIHVSWSLAAGGRLGVGNDPRYSKTRCFDPFPFPDPPAPLRERIGELGEKLDAFRKERQKEHPELTLTEMYNVLEKLRKGAPLEKKEPEIHQKGLISVLKKIHDDLDAAVFEAYGWPSTLTDEEILERLVALNAERAEEERQGKVRWLRPEYQNPGGARPASQTSTPTEDDGDEEGEEEEGAEAGPKKPAWPTKTREQIVAVRDLLLGPGEDWTALQVARAFKRVGKTTHAEVQTAVQEVLESLEALGLLVSYEDESQERHWRRAGAPVTERSVARRASVPPSKGGHGAG
jgi:hypothetical protein